ncbi:ATP-binding cassette sub-family C member Sur isoform X2 [Venturia canescens]|uniref:ATP-binding cassette sub-family C member Sur isoform X2 n=1 Tax=Venturia canescens TaxID=32260 RepID=UPI001C9C4DC1|nr:ATP-binding cassette sub-family C member Sur isoform X2 [Venturia canescens]
MGLCEDTAFLRLLPTSGWHLVWSWQAGNGTTVKKIGSASPRSDCFVELVNLAVAVVVLLVTIGIVVKYKRGDDIRRSSTRLLPLHTLRSVLCIILTLFLVLELSESMMELAPLSQILSLMAIISCWFLHRETEMRDGLGLAGTGGSFATVALARAWRLYHLQRYGLTASHVRTITTGGTALISGFLSAVDSYVLYRMMQKSKRYEIRGTGYRRISYRHKYSTFVGKLTFHWVVDLLTRGYRSPLDLNDLGELPDEESTVVQFRKFRHIFESRKKSRSDGKIKLWPCYWERVWPCFAIGGVLKLLGDATTLVGPMAISRIVDDVSSRQNSTVRISRSLQFEGFVTFGRLMENGYFVGLLMFFAAIFQSTLSQASTHFLNVEGIRLRTALQALVYDKSLRLYSWTISEEEEPTSKQSAKEKSWQRNGQAADIGTLTNLMAEDVYNVMSFFWIGHYTWAIPLKIAAIVFLLYVKLGISAIIGAICCIVIVTPLQLYLGKKMSSNLKMVAEKSDARLRLVNEVLQGMRLVKLRAWEKLFEARVKNTRNEELSLLDKDSLYWALITFLTHASSVLTTLFTFGVYFWIEERHLDAGNVFASLALFSQLTVPLFIFPVIVPIIINATISTSRLEEFLSLPEIVDVLPETSPETSSPEEERASSAIEANSQPDPKSLRSASTFGTLGNIDEDEEEANSHLLGKRDSGIMSSSTDTVFVEDSEPRDSIYEPPLLQVQGVFSWGDDNYLTVREIDIPRGKLTLVVGRTGSGKTSLISAILGEMQQLQGRVKWAKDAKITYVSQKPWLLNATLRDNILFGSSYRPRRYRSVLRACALQPDVDILPGRDLTRIGEKGINLSGGQKQRITIARAIYSDADTLILDDPLSALDQQVGQQIFENGIQKLLLRRGRTVIMVTHRLDFLGAADHIIAMDCCGVREVGTKSTIESSDPILGEEWRQSSQRRGLVNKEIHKTAKDRWSLVRLISRIGISVKHRNANDGSWSTDRDAYVIPPSFVPLRLRRSTLSGSRYLAHDLTDLPVPAEEWGALRRKSRKHRVAVRSTSLQPPKNPPPFLRRSSTPTILESRYTVPRNKRHSVLDGGQNSSMLKQLFSGRIVSVTSEEATMSRERSVLRRLMSTTSSSTSKISQGNGESDHRPLKRLISADSSTTIEDIEEESEIADCEESTSSCSSESSEGLVTKNIWMGYLKAGGLAPSLGYFGAALASQALRIYTDLWLSRWTDLGIESEKSIHVREETVFYFRMYVLLSISSIVIAAVNSAAGQWAGAKSREKIHEEAISGLLGAPLNFFEKTPIGRVLNRFSADMGVVDKKLSTALQRLTSFVLLCASAILVNVFISPWFLAAAFPTCVVYYVLQRFYRRSARELQRLEGSTRGPVAAHFSETLAGLPIVRASKQQPRFMREMIEHLDANTNAFLVLNTSTRWLGIALDYLGAAVVVTATYAALLTAETYPDRVSPALVGLAVNYTLLVPIYLNWVVKFVSEIEMYMGSVARLRSYAKTAQENYRENGISVSENWPERGEIIFDNVSLRYDSQAEPVVENLNLRIPAGQKLGICGRTGSGKSSTLMALFQLLQVSQGRIIVDGIDLREISLATLRSRLSAIPQDVIMFSGSIRENLDPLGEYEDAELWRALELGQMKEIVGAHPEGLDFEVREGGENFSSGQLQLLSMARAVLRRSSIVILDEVTSALDFSTEKSLLGAVTSAFKDKTLITIAHRVASLMDCDRVVVFDEGRIVEEGPPRELAQRPMGFFTAMLRAGDTSNDEKT